MQNRKFKTNFTTKFEYSQAKSLPTHKISVIYIHGLFSDCWGRKPESVKEWCEARGIGFFRYELAGHGSDSARYEEADMAVWKAQILEVIDEMVDGPVVLVGSSIGGWLSLLAAAERPDRVRGVVGLAAAPDFTKDLEQYIFTPEQKQTMAQTGRLEFATKDFSYTFTKKMFDTAREMCLLGREIPIDCPVHLLQGMKDDCIAPDKAMNIAKCLRSSQVAVKMLKNSNHRLCNQEDIRELFNSLESMV